MSLIEFPALLAAVPGEIPPWQWWSTVGVAGVLIAATTAYSYATQGGIIARATTKEAIRQPVFLLLMAIALVILVLNMYLPFFTFGEDVKMLKDCGLATLLVCGLLMAVWTSSNSVAQEIEGKTAMTLLSKPINRRQFIVGKYVGILQSVLFLLLPIVVVFLLLVYYKVGYDAKEVSQEIPEHAQRLQITLQTLPGIALIVLEVCVLTAVSVAISTRMPMVVNIVICFTVFVLGRLTPILVGSDALRPEGTLEPVQFVARLFATVLPAEWVYDTQSAVATGIDVPPAYLGYALLYTAAYCTAVILLAFLMFEDRDLA
ncbi:MAG: ABC transporter permease subunit [Planctomycetaceae bacterium]